MNKNIKQALIAILIGASISFLSVLFEGLLNLLQDHGPEVVGSLAGVGRFLLKWKPVV